MINLDNQKSALTKCPPPKQRYQHAKIWHGKFDTVIEYDELTAGDKPTKINSSAIVELRANIDENFSVLVSMWFSTLAKAYGLQETAKLNFS